ncbi:FAD-dependent oxidoreductase [Blastococcus sp. HT6-30]|uniref:FAD-dependent oxidoreductase n=1 Tax=Blastococcus sp. HT6-30 TaxID=3144843 RepID=UPI00321B43E7
MSAAERTYDVVVLGAGSTGENVADVVVRGGLSALLVEPELVGCECSYWACMPSKTLLRGTEVLAEARAARGDQRRGGPGPAPVLGGGYVGCEMATAWQALGSQVTVLQRGDRLLPRLEPGE